MRPLVVLGLLVCSGTAACTAKPRQDSVARSTALDAALAACADETKPDVDPCRMAVRLGLVESGARLPETEAFYTRMARALLAEGQVAEATALYRTAVRRYPLNADLPYELGMVLVDRLGASEEALGPFMLAVKRRPRFPEAMLALARVQHELGYDDEAIGQSRALLAIDSSSREAFCLLAQLLTTTGKAEEARAACTQARRPTAHGASECACTP
jgi:tetratricopeptide (TPR) repeat protein